MTTMDTKTNAIVPARPRNVRTLLSDIRGAELVQVLIVVALLALASMGAMTALKDGITTNANKQKGAIEKI